VPLRQAAAEIARGVIPPRTVVVTFDDGYEDTIATALPLLRRHEVPATVFVTTGNPGEPFWWDTLASLVLGAPRLPERIVVEAGGRSHVLSTRPRKQFLQRAAAILRPLDAGIRRTVIDGLMDQYPPDDRSAPPRALRSDEIQRLGQEPLVEVGGHTVTHPVLASLPPERQRAEIDENRLTLESLIGEPVRSFSYPHGSYAPATRGLLQDAGYTAACCSEPDVATARADRYALPRLWVDRARGPRFGRWIDHWLG
jgi:peptidoglycan/xylan/chitin deacetylase (PgdA/CDA1 family)